MRLLIALAALFPAAGRRVSGVALENEHLRIEFSPATSIAG
jgi:hypothetical protein